MIVQHRNEYFLLALTVHGDFAPFASTGRLRSLPLQERVLSVSGLISVSHSSTHGNNIESNLCCSFQHTPQRTATHWRHAFLATFYAGIQYREVSLCLSEFMFMCLPRFRSLQGLQKKAFSQEVRLLAYFSESLEIIFIPSYGIFVVLIRQLA